MQVSLEHYAVGAKAASELANTVAGATADDTLGTPGDLALLARRNGLAVPDELTDSDVREVRRLRTTVRELISHGQERDAVHTLNDMLAACRADVLLEQAETRTGAYEWQLAVADTGPIERRLKALIASGLLATVRILGFDRFRTCEADFCNGAFVDTTRPGRQRFCNPKRCGNRTHVAAHRARTGA